MIIHVNNGSQGNNTTILNIYQWSLAIMTWHYLWKMLSHEIIRQINSRRFFVRLTIRLEICNVSGAILSRLLIMIEDLY